MKAYGFSCQSSICRDKGKRTRVLHLVFHYNKGNQTRSASTKERMFFLSPGLEKQLEVFLISGVLLEGNTILVDVVQKTSFLI